MKNRKSNQTENIVYVTDKKEFFAWIKAHKKELVIAGVGISALISIILGIKNKDVLTELWKSLHKTLKHTPEIDAKITGSVTTTIPVSCEAPESIIENAVSIIPVAVNKHIRNLPDGWKASPKKIASATENGYILESGQTWVDNYTRGAIAA